MVLKSTEPSWRRKIVIPCIIGEILFASFLPLMINNIQSYQAYRETVRQEQEAEKERESRRVESFVIRGYGYEIKLDKWLLEKFGIGPYYIAKDGNLNIWRGNESSITFTFYSEVRSEISDAGRLYLPDDPSKWNWMAHCLLEITERFGSEVVLLCYPVDKNGITDKAIFKKAFRERHSNKRFEGRVEWRAENSNLKYLEIGRYSNDIDTFPILAIVYDSIENYDDRRDLPADEKPAALKDPEPYSSDVVPAEEVTKRQVDEQEPMEEATEPEPMEDVTEPEVVTPAPPEPGEEAPETIEEAIPFQLVEEKPSFQGGDANTFSKWVNSKLVYPEIAKENGVSGRVTLQFTVNIDGSVSNVKVLRGVDASLDKEAVRVVSSSPKWKPGKQKDRAVKVTYTFPVVFKL